MHAQPRPTLCDPRDYSFPDSSVHGIFQAKNTRVDCHFLLQGIFLTQGLNPRLLRLPHWQTDSLPLTLSHLGSPYVCVCVCVCFLNLKILIQKFFKQLKNCLREDKYLVENTKFCLVQRIPNSKIPWSAQRRTVNSNKASPSREHDKWKMLNK